MPADMGDMTADMMQEMPPEAMGSMTAPMMEAMPPEAMAGMDAGMMEAERLDNFFVSIPQIF